jgi:hypothetical protein
MNAAAAVALTRMPHSAKEKGRSKDPFTAALLLCCTSGVPNAQNEEEEEERNTTASALPTPLGFSLLSPPAPQTPNLPLPPTSTTQRRTSSSSKFRVQDTVKEPIRPKAVKRNLSHKRWETKFPTHPAPPQTARQLAPPSRCCIAGTLNVPASTSASLLGVFNTSRSPSSPSCYCCNY